MRERNAYCARLVIEVSFLVEFFFYREIKDD